MRFSRLIGIVSLLPCLAYEQDTISSSRNGTQSPPSPAVVRIGPGVTPPRLRSKVEPTYSAQALTEFVQGTVVLDAVIDDQGLPRKITVVSPLGFGLDESAEGAVGKWRFFPGEKEGQAVSVQVTVEVNFRLSGRSFNHKLERKRTSFNEAAAFVERPDPVVRANAVKTIEQLASENYPPAMFTVGMWQIDGKRVAADRANGLVLVQKAANKDYGPALYEVAIRLIRGQDLPLDTDRGLKTMQEAALLE